jgi:hypothetical protein
MDAAKLAPRKETLRTEAPHRRYANFAMRINHLGVALLIVLSSVAGHAQAPDSDKVNDLATAISHAEGFGRRSTIPSRYHNPGDLKAFSNSTPVAGQVRLGKAGHIVFKDDEAGKAALRDYIVRMVDGRSRHFHSDMTLNQVARVYAEDWRPWVKAVSRELGVPPTTTLRAYFYKEECRRSVPSRSEAPKSEPAPVVLSFRALPAANPAPKPPAISIPESRGVLTAMLDTPVDVPPLVETAPQHHRLPQLIPARLHLSRPHGSGAALQQSGE